MYVCVVVWIRHKGWRGGQAAGQRPQDDVAMQRVPTPSVMCHFLWVFVLV